MSGELKSAVLTGMSGSVSDEPPDRKSTRLNSSHLVISYAVFCLKKKKPRSTSAYPLHGCATLIHPPRRTFSGNHVAPKASHPQHLGSLAAATPLRRALL